MSIDITSSSIHLGLLLCLGYCKEYCYGSVFISFEALTFSSFPDICPGVGLLDHMLTLIFNFLRNPFTVFHSHCTIYLLQQVLKGPLLPTPSVALTICRFFWWWPVWPVWDGTSLTYISLIFSYVEHLFMCLLTTCISSLKKCLCRSSALFLIVLFNFLSLSCIHCLYILEINFFLVTSFANVFSHSIVCLFVLWFPLMDKRFQA